MTFHRVIYTIDSLETTQKEMATTILLSSSIEHVHTHLTLMSPPAIAWNFSSWGNEEKVG